MRLPDFLIIGAPKAGTSSLAETLRRHPDVYFSDPKELNYFTRHLDRGAEWYGAHFADARPDQLCGEGTPAYSGSAKTAQIAADIREIMPAVKLIYMVRDPLERALSSYFQQVENGMERIGVSRAILERSFVLEASLYEARLQDYLAHFSADQIHIMFLEDLQADYDASVQACLRFLGLADQPSLPHVHTNRRDRKQTDGALLRRLKAGPIKGLIKQVAPRALIRKGKQMLRNDVQFSQDEKTLTAEARRHAIAVLEPDARAFLARTNRTTDLWPWLNEDRTASAAGS